MKTETTTDPEIATDSPEVAGCAAMHCCAERVTVGDTLICLIDEWRRGEKSAFDGSVTSVRGDGVDVCYLSGYRSRNDFVEWGDVVARLDKSLPWVKIDGIPYSGHFEIFQHND